MVRILCWLQTALLGGNGLVMLFAGLWWYGLVPGVTATGPYNPHFVRDIGAAYLVCGLSHAAFALWPRLAWSALAASAAFLTLHAGIHVFDAVCGSRPLADLARDFAGVFLPALVALGLTALGPTALGSTGLGSTGLGGGPGGIPFSQPEVRHAQDPA